MVKHYEILVDALVECVKNGCVNDAVLSDAQKNLEFAYDRMKVEGKPTEVICRHIEQIKTIRFDL